LAGLAAISVRVYGSFECGDYPVPAQVVDWIAAALQKSEAQRAELWSRRELAFPPRLYLVRIRHSGTVSIIRGNVHLPA
jgi:hypothetical protein